MKHILSVSLLTLIAGVSASAQSASTSGLTVPATPNTTQMLALANANAAAADASADQPAAAKPATPKSDVAINTGKGSKNFWANWLEAHRRVTPASKHSTGQLYAKAFADAAATPTAGADAAPEPAPGPEPIGPAVNKETDAAKEIQILKDRLDRLQKVIDEQSQGGANAPAAPPAPLKIPEPLSAPDPAPANDKDTPFAYGDQSWFNGSPRNSPVIDTKFVTGEVRFDTHFMEDFNQPIDHTMGGATESFRSGEFQVEQISVGGDFHYDNVRGRILTMFGLFAVTTPRGDGSSGVGQWDVRNAYRYVSEAYGGYHFNVAHGLNVDAGIFVSYIGLFSYYNFDNWSYQPSFVSSNTPWFFNGLRIQYFPTQKLKIEPWIINGWQSYNRFNGHRGLGGQILWIPTDSIRLVFNNYGNGTDTLGNPGRSRIQTDDSIEVRYFNKPMATGIDKMAFTFTGDLGCEYGGGVTCHGGSGGPKQAFLGWMAYDRTWWGHDKYALTIGGGQMNNPGRYLTLLPPINGADAVSGSPYFTGNPGDKAHMWDANANLQWMPKSYITWWAEATYRHADVPYWSGRGGITPPGGNTGSPGQYVCGAGGSAGTNDLATAYTNCGDAGVWFPDLRKGQMTFSVGVMVKF